MKFIQQLLLLGLLGWGNVYAQSNLPPCQLSGFLHNCFGTYNFANGNKYLGEFKDRKPNGQGTYTFANGNKYVGQFKDGKRNGQFIVSFASGDKYVGEFKDDKIDGQGRYSFANGNKYVGEFKDDKPNGHGTYSFASGNKYVGQFKDEKRSGLGTLYSRNGAIAQDGIWAEDKFISSTPIQQASVSSQLTDPSLMAPNKAQSNLPACPSSGYLHNCYGTFTYSNGNKYVGEWKDDKFGGQGTLFLYGRSDKKQGIWSDGVLIQSSLVQASVVDNQAATILPPETINGSNLPSCQGSEFRNLNNCFGTFTFPDGAKYVGEWKAMMMHGQGTLISAKGVKYIGEWKDNNYNGQGTLLASNGSVINQGIWANGNFIRPAPLEQAAVPTALSSNAEGDRLAAEVEAERKKRLISEQQLASEARNKEQQRLALEAQQQEQLRIAQVATQKELERILAEQKVKEQERLADAARSKEQQRLAQEASELSRLRAEAEESKRKQAELEEQLRLAKLQNQVNPPSAMTTMANRRALVIGNDTYKSVAKLLNAREDAKAISSNLTAVGYKVTLHLDLNEKEMKAALRAFSSQVQGGDEVMFFFAGHGVQLGATNYLLPTDIGGESEAQVKDEAIQLQRVLDDMTEKKAKFTLAMIDACRDNPFKSAGRSIGGRGLAPTTAATGQMVVFSAGSGQQALDRLGNTDKNKNGVFTRTFLKEMQKPGVSIDRIVKNVRNEVAELAKTVGHEQVPAIYDQVLGDFYFKK
jgi:hypothetical protein